MNPLSGFTKSTFAAISLFHSNGPLLQLKSITSLTRHPSSSFRPLPRLQNLCVLYPLRPLQTRYGRFHLIPPSDRIPSYRSSMFRQHLKHMFALQFAHWTGMYELDVLGGGLLLDLLGFEGGGKVDVGFVG